MDNIVYLLLQVLIGTIRLMMSYVSKKVNVICFLQQTIIDTEGILPLNHFFLTFLLSCIYETSRLNRNFSIFAFL